MLPVSGNVNASPRKISCKLVIGNNTITSVKMLTYASDWSGGISIGQVISSYISVTLPTPSFSIAGANVSLSMGIGSPVEWVAIGGFKVDEESIQSRQGLTSFKAYDKLHDTLNTYESALTYPTTLQDICDEVCAQIGITSTTLGPGVSTTVEADILSGYTLRDVLGFIAAMVGKNAYLSATNQLELKWFASVNYIADGTRANVPYTGESDCTVGRLICQNAEEVITSGSGQGIFFMCPLMTQTRLNSIRYNVVGLTYRKADVDIRYGNFCLQSGDIITVTASGTTLTIPIMANSWTYDGGLSSSVSSYGVVDYEGTANNTERATTTQRVKGIIDQKASKIREGIQYATLQASILLNVAKITGDSGGVIKIKFDANNHTQELLVLDTGDEATAQNVLKLDANGVSHSGTGYSGTYTPIITASGRVKTMKTGTGDQPQVRLDDGAILIDKVNGGTLSNVGAIEYIYNQVDAIALLVKQGKALIIGVKGASDNTPEFYYYPSPPSGAGKFNFSGNVKVVGDVFFGSGGGTSLNTITATVNVLSSANIVSRLEALEQDMNYYNSENIVLRIEALEQAVNDLDSRVTALEGAQ